LKAASQTIGGDDAMHKFMPPGPIGGAMKTSFERPEVAAGRGLDKWLHSAAKHCK
jgi:hypothetical protein